MVRTEIGCELLRRWAADHGEFGGKRSVDKLGSVVNIATDSDLIGEPSVEIGRPVFVAA